MSRELEVLNIAKVSRDSTDIDHWLPSHNHPDLDRPITKMVLGFVPSENRYYPVEVDITKNTNNTIFVVGGPDSGKEDLVKSILQFQGERTAEGYLKVDMVLRHDSQYELDKTWGIKRHIEKNGVAYAPEGKIAEVVLSRIVADLETKQKRFSFKQDNPRILVVDDLGNFFRKGRPENTELLKKTLTYKGPRSFATICMVEDTDLDDLSAQGFNTGEKSTGGIWLIGKSIATEDLYPDFPSGYFLQWSPSKLKLGELPIKSFTPRR